MVESRNTYESPSEPGQNSAAPNEPKPWWTKNLFVFAAMMLAAYLILPAFLALDAAASGSPYLKEFLDFGIMAPLVVILFQWPLLVGYAIAILVVLGTTSNFAIRCVLGAVALIVYAMAIFYWFVMAVVAG